MEFAEYYAPPSISAWFDFGLTSINGREIVDTYFQSVIILFHILALMNGLKNSFPASLYSSYEELNMTFTSRREPNNQDESYCTCIF